ncbi:MAG: DUF4349 domain-containing protein [Actinomycetota bacterium]
MVRTRIAAVAGAMLVASAAVACSGSDDGGGAGGDGGSSTGGSSSRALEAQADLAVGGAPAPSAATKLPNVGASVIKTAVVTVGVADDKLEGALQSAIQVAGRLGGFVASTTIGEDMGTVVIRVPSERFELALADLEELGKVAKETVSGEDVGQEFVDLQARLRNWQSQEAVLLRLMDRSRSVSDTIRVQGELSRVQFEIERLRGRLGFLEDQTDLGTITATFTGDAGAPAEPTTLARAWSEATGAALAVIAAGIVAVGFAAPIALLAGVVLLVRGLRPRFTS